MDSLLGPRELHAVFVDYGLIAVCNSLEQAMAEASKAVRLLGGCVEVVGFVESGERVVVKNEAV